MATKESGWAPIRPRGEVGVLPPIAWAAAKGSPELSPRCLRRELRLAGPAALDGAGGNGYGAAEREAWPSGFHWLTLLVLLLVTAAGARAATDTHDWRGDWELPDGFTMHIDTEAYDAPTSIAFVPNPGTSPKSPRYYVTELEGRVKVVTQDRSVYTFAEKLWTRGALKDLPDPDGESGTAAITLEPERGYIFVSFTYRDPHNILRNGMVRFDCEPQVFGLKPLRTHLNTELFKQDISLVTHQIGSMVLDGTNLMVSVGDGGQHFKCENVDSTLGKLLRMTLDMKPVRDNPYYEDDDPLRPVNYVWASGLRNPFGLTRVGDRYFATENGFDIDRFLEIRQADNFHWDGHDWSIGMNAPLVLGPTHAPVHLVFLPQSNTLFPPEHRSKFYVAMAGGKSMRAGLLAIDYDFARSRLASRPRQFALHLTEKDREVDPVGVAIGPDGLYMVSLYPVRKDRGAKGAVVRISYDPANQISRFLGADAKAQTILVGRACYNCHGQRTTDLNVAPPLDRETLVPRILERLHSKGYRSDVAELDRVEIAPYAAYRAARKEVLAARGDQQARLWMTYHILEPMFDRKSSAMPNLGLSREEAEDVANYLVRQNIGSTGLVGFVKSCVHPFLYGPAKRRHLVGAFAMGFCLAFALLAGWKLAHPTRTQVASASAPASAPAERPVSKAA